MANRTTTMKVSGNPHNPFDVIHINDERWIVVATTLTGRSSTVLLEPLADFVAKSKLISDAPYDCTVAEYIERLCDEYESNLC